MLQLAGEGGHRSAAEGGMHYTKQLIHTLSSQKMWSHRSDCLCVSLSSDGFASIWFGVWVALRTFCGAQMLFRTLTRSRKNNHSFECTSRSKTSRVMTTNGEKKR